MLRKRITNLIVAIASISGFVVAAPVVMAEGNSNAGVKVTICHATGSATNPFVQISPNANGVISGHVDHQDGRDIIPPFDYNDHGTMKHFAGQNFDAQGQAILRNGCKVPAGGQGGGITPPPTTTQGGQGGETLGANTQNQAAASGQGASVSATPAGGVNAGVGGVSTVSLGAFAGLAVSLASVALGVRRLGKFEA
jgi:hypothetical protein